MSCGQTFTEQWEALPDLIRAVGFGPVPLFPVGSRVNGYTPVIAQEPENILMPHSSCPDVGAVL